MNAINPQRLLEFYGLSGTTVLAPMSGYRNTVYPVQLPDGRLYNLILFKHEEGILNKIRDANKVSDYLSFIGFPTRTTEGRIMRLGAKTTTGHPITKYACLYSYLPGHTIPWEGYTMRHIKLLGLSMSEMHAALATAPRLQVTDDAAVEFEWVRNYMEQYFARPGVVSALQSKLSLQINPQIFATTRTALMLTHGLPGQQILHMDFVRGNILFSTGLSSLMFDGLAITGILDFEKTSRGHRVMDIARTLAFLMVDCKSKTPEAVVKYFLQSGYNRHGILPFKTPVIKHQGRRLNLLHELINFFLVHDFYKFLEHNPYEFLPQNEHFVRTVALLKKRRILL